MFLVDTNLLVYATSADLREHRQAKTCLDPWRSADEPWYLTWSIVYEFLRVMTHRNILPHPLTFSEGWDFVETLRTAPSLEFLVETARHPAIIHGLAAEYPRIRGNHLHDLHIAALMKEHGITEIRTAGTDCLQFKFLRVTNPLETS